MIKEKSYTRITLSLDIIRKLKEGPYAGYHELNILKHQIDLHDVVSIKPSDTIGITCDHPEVPTDERNICWRIVEILKKEYDIAENVHIIIVKNIPVKGGLAGGSTNAATVLSLLNKYWQLNLNKEQFYTIAGKVGMDIPFYFIGGTAFDTEATGVLESIPTLCSFDFVLATPDFGVSTREAYNSIDYSRIGQDTDKTRKMRLALEAGNHEAVIALMHNDFEESVFKHYPQLKQIKEELLDAGCLNAVLSGSGSTIIGVVKDRKQAEQVKDVVSVPVICASTI